MFFNFTITPILVALTLVLSPMSFAQQVETASETLQQGLKHTQETLHQGKTSQFKVNKLASETDALLTEYQAMLKKAEYQKSYNQELKVLQQEQVAELASLDQQIKDIIITKQQLLPLLREMVQTLEQFIKLDLPFRRQQRLTSVDKLTQLLASSSVSISEKYRRVMELYQAENDHNYDLEVYRDKIEINQQELSVQVLRIGRSNLYCQTMDAKLSAMWNQENKTWDVLDSRYQLNIRRAMRIAAKKAAPELLELPHSLLLDKGGR